MASGNGDTANRLSLVGVNLPHVGYGKMVQGLRQALEPHVILDDHAEHVVFALRPNLVSGWYKNQKPTLLTMWETNWLPPEFSEYLYLYDKVIVPSLHNFDLFSQHHDNVHVIPLAVDRTIWYPQPDPETDTFRLVCGGSEWYRKGLDVVLDVFNMLGLPNTELHIKIVPPYLAAPANLDYPNVVVHRRWMTVEQERDLVTSAHGFISVSRGEGFGLMSLQAISAGVPTILTDAHGHREFSDLATHRIQTTQVPTNAGVWQDMGDWDEPDRDQLAEAIIDLKNNWDTHRQTALKNAEETTAFNWDTSATQLVRIVKPTPNQVNPIWQAQEPTCEIRVRRKIEATIGEHHINLVPGNTYTVVLNVRDVLKQSGYLEAV